MSDFLRMADKAGNHLTSVGHALETVARLLGADGIEHNLSPRDTKGLIHTVLALGETIRDTGYELCSAVEDEEAEVTVAVLEVRRA